MAARLLDMHPQTLRKYERLGLVRPTRTVGTCASTRSDELERLRLIKHLVDDAGVNLAGVQRLLSIAEAVQRLRQAVREDGARSDARRRMAQEIDRIGEMVGLEAASESSTNRRADGACPRENGVGIWLERIQ